MSDLAVVSPKPAWTADRIERSLGSYSDWIVLGSLLLAFAIRLWSTLGTYLNPDEALHYLIVNHSSLSDVYQASLLSQHPPLYFALLYYWHFAGNSEVMLRLPSVVASTAVAWVAFRWIAMVLGRTAGFITLLLLAFSPVLTALGAISRHASRIILRVNSKSAYPRRPRFDGRLGVIWPPW